MQGTTIRNYFVLSNLYTGF